ncbi:DegT/DnrJ/EryC1/StrS family aminotransferase [Bartonella raoultii]|uniref:DegT/DnrJ/EryC1/StrS aminotransferase family protein n=1 Tax=Bartonella raoultii TaxID=1457020 RepID=A0ABS7I519_9HYPH|nr:DegT/DnrJ/EryC1/StrS aminotransferase family protein [Bartonella raoultii]MBX4335126.1 DegT/DnrJ/EryC1/StrS aminotransferase family protein [Bartonella raoultii]
MQFIDLGAQHARIEDKINAAIAHVVASGKYILGPKVTEFEERLADYLGVKHVIACANGTDALKMPLMAKKIGPGDAVFCPSFTFSATAEVIALVGAEPVFVDVLSDTFNMNVEKLCEAIKMIKKEGRLKPKAIITVDLFGLPADYAQIAKVAEKENLFVIEDAAQSMGGRSANIMCGAFGDVAATSFYPAKPLGCYGDGGAMMTNNDHLAALLRSILFHGKGETQYDNVRIGMNSRLDAIQAAILLEKFAIFEDEMEKRVKIAQRYSNGLRDIVEVPEVGENVRCAYAQYTLKVKNRDELKDYLQKNSIPTMIYYKTPLHQQPAYKHFPYIEGSLSVSDSLGESVLSLPMHPYLIQADQDMIIQKIRDFYHSSK